MSILVMTITTIQCDGPVAGPCPANSFKIYEFPQATAMRMSRKEGWNLSADGMIACPECGQGETAVTVPSIPARRLEPAAVI